jgi:hypothetical protein
MLEAVPLVCPTLRRMAPVPCRALCPVSRQTDFSDHKRVRRLFPSCRRFATWCACESTVPISEPSYFATGSDNRDDEKIMLNELVPIEACLNSSGAGTSLFWSSVVRYSRIL